MSNIKLLTLSFVMSFGMTTAAMASDAINCSNAKNQNREECVRAKVNVNNQNDVVDCSNAQNQHKEQCVRTKVNVNNQNDVVHCGNAKDQNKDECVRAKHNYRS